MHDINLRGEVAHANDTPGVELGTVQFDHRKAK
jgi:hypothetical protein